MGRIGFSEILVLLIMLAMPLGAVALGFVIGFFVGKSAGLKQARLEAQPSGQAGPQRS